MFISREKLDHYLGVQQEEESKIMITAQGRGPGYYDPQLALRSKDPWLQITSSLYRHKRKKIIFASSFLYEETPLPVESAFFSALIEHYDVYLWPRDGKGLTADSCPLTSTLEFWQQRMSVRGNSQKEILEIFEQQKISTDDVIIIDDIFYYALFDKWMVEKGVDDCIPDKIVFNQRLEKIDDEISSRQIIRLEHPLPEGDHFRLLLKKFPNLQFLEIQYANQVWVDQHFKYLQNKHITLNHYYARFVYPANAALKSLVIDGSPSVVINDQHSTLEKINILESAYFASLKCDAVQELQVRVCKSIELHPMPSLRKLKLAVYGDDTEELKIPIDQYPKLEDLSIGTWKSQTITINHPLLTNLKCEGMVTAHITNAPSLKKFAGKYTLALPTSIEELKTNTVIDFGIYNQLKKLEVLATHITSLPKSLQDIYFVFQGAVSDYSHLNELKILKIRGGKSTKISLPNPLLQTVTIQHSDLTEIILPASNNLKRLEINSCDSLKTLDLLQANQLEIFSIQSCRSLKKLSNLPSSLKSLQLEQMIDVEYSLLNLDRLENLQLIPYFSTSDKLLSLPRLPHLKRLRIGNCFNLTDMDLILFPNLEEFVMFDCAQIKNIIFNAPKLKIIKLISMSYLALTDKIEFSRLTPELEDVEMTIKALKSGDFQGLKQLRTISIITCEGTTDIYLNDCEKLQNLKINCINNCNLHTVNLPRSLKTVAINSANLYSEGKTIIQRETKEEHIQELKIAPVSRFSLNAKGKIDNETGLQTPLQSGGEGKFSVELYGRFQPISPEIQRINVFDKIEYSNKHLFFSFTQLNHAIELKIPTCYKRSTESLEEAFLNLKQAANKNQEDHFEIGFLKSDNIKVGELVKLPSSQLLKKDSIIDFHYEPLDAQIKLFWDEDYNQHFFSATDNSHKKNYLSFITNSASIYNVKILYRVKKNPDYEKNHATRIKEGFSVVSEKKGSWLLNQELWLKLIVKIFHFQPLNFMLNDKLSIEEKIEQLATYCHFEQKEVPPLSSKHELDIIWYNIINRAGVCRHRAQAFFLLANFLNVKARMIENGVHAYCEVAYQSCDKSTIVWSRHDLGGGVAPILLDAHNDTATPTIDSLPTSPSLPSAAEIDSLPTSSPLPLAPENKLMESQERVRARYIHHFKDLAAQNQITSVCLLLEKKEGESAPLIELTSSQTPLSMNGHIFRSLQEEKWDIKNYLYIHEANDFKFYFIRKRITDDKRLLITEDGPLKNIIENGGLLVINWDNFSPTEKLIYKSVLDKLPSLDGKFLSEKCRVVGLTAKSQKDSAFISRCKRLCIPSISSLKSEDEKKTEFAIDLFGLPSWRSELLGTITHIPGGICLAREQLIDAMKNGNSIVILNLPDDPELTDMLSQIQNERRIFHNGEWVEAKSTFRLQTGHKSHDDLLTEFISRVKGEEKSEEKSEEKLQSVFIGLHNYFDLFSQMVIVDSKAITQPGLLATYKNNKNIVFYLTESLPKNYAEKIMFYIKEHFSESTFQFTLAPGVAIQNDISNSKKIQPEKWIGLSPPSCRVIMSNDPDLCCQQLYQALAEEKRPPLIVDITPEMTWNDLMTSIKIGSRSVCEEHDVLTALKSGRNVILNGKLSPLLYQQLLPLFSENGEIIINGDLIRLPGKLYAVTSTCPLITRTAERHYDEKVYSELFDKKAQDRVAQLFKFYHYAKCWPHRGEGRPTEFRISFQRLKNMVSTLSTPSLHKNNPIKGLFLYDYPRHSEDYAYLSVIAKYFLTSESATTRHHRNKKLIKWLNRLNLYSIEKQRQHAWKLLNCFNGSEIKTILGLDLEKNINLLSGRPQLSRDAFNRLQAAIHSHGALLSSTSEKTAVGSKHEMQLQTLLADKNKPIIFLKGPTAAGKTYLVDHLDTEKKTLAIYKGNKNIMRWLTEAAPRQIKILHLDEANMLLPDTLNFLKGLTREQHTIYYHGREYPITSAHKVILTGNPEYYPNRYYHELIQDYAETLYIARPSREQLIQQIEPLLATQKRESFAPYLVDICEMVSDYVAFFEASRREIHNIALRFLVLSETATTYEALNKKLLEAAISEFSGSIKDLSKRTAFVKALHSKLTISFREEKQPPLIDVLPDYVIPQQKYELLFAVEQNLKMRQYCLETKTSACSYKPIILIEGSSGVGKTTFLQKMMEKAHILREEFKEYKEPYSCKKNNYYFVSAGAPHATKTIEQAFNEGAIVVLDELNADETLEEFLINLESRKPAHPGFMMFASQNASIEHGRYSISEALRSRAHCLYMDNLTHQELTALAEHQSISYPDIFAEEYCKASLQSSAINLRKFYESLNFFSVTKKKTEAVQETKQVLKV